MLKLPRIATSKPVNPIQGLHPNQGHVQPADMDPLLPEGN